MSSSSGPDEPLYSGSLIDEFNKFTNQIALELVQEDLEVIKNLIFGKIPIEELSCIKRGTQLVFVLKKYKLLSKKNLDVFGELLEESRRVDLAKRVKEYKDTSVRNAPQAQMEEITDQKQKIHCDQTFDTILAIHLPVGHDSEKLKSVLQQCESAMKIYHSEHKHSVNSQLAVIQFGNHSSAPMCFPEEQQIAFLEKDFSHSLEISSHVKPDSVCGGAPASGIADALVEAYNLRQKMRREATKLCIIVYFLSTNSANLEHYRCPCGYDAVYLSHLLATHAIPLYIIGIDLERTLACSSKQVEENYLLSGITAITGGRYFQIQDTCVLEKLIQCIIKENHSIEKNMGTVNDVVITEINQQYGDVDEFHLAEHLYNNLRLRSCRVDCITQNGKPLTPISQISERVSWADNLDDAITAVKSMKKRMSTTNNQNTSKQNSSPPSESTVSGYSGIQKPNEIETTNQNPDLEISDRMVRRQIERSAYYRPNHTEMHV